MGIKNSYTESKCFIRFSLWILNSQMCPKMRFYGENREIGVTVRVSSSFKGRKIFYSQFNSKQTNNIKMWLKWDASVCNRYSKRPLELDQTWVEPPRKKKLLSNFDFVFLKSVYSIHAKSIHTTFVFRKSRSTTSNIHAFGRYVRVWL